MEDTPPPGHKLREEVEAADGTVGVNPADARGKGVLSDETTLTVAARTCHPTRCGQTPTLGDPCE